MNSILISVIIMIILMYLLNYALSFLIAFALFPITTNMYLNGFIVMGGIGVILGFIMNILQAPMVVREVELELNKNKN